MRLMIFALGVLFLTGFASAISDSCDPNMIAYYEMEDSAGGSVTDSYGSYDGTGFPGSGALIVDGAAIFDGTQKISIIDSGGLDLYNGPSGANGFAIEFWVQKTGLSFVDETLLNKGNYNIKWTATDTIEATVNGVTVISGDLDSGVPYHVALTWVPQIPKDMTLYIDGAFVDSATLDETGSDISSPLEIGEDFVGLIDEVAFYDAPLSSEDVIKHHSTSEAGRDYCYGAGAGNFSTAETHFTLAGCMLPNGVDSITGGSCSSDGMYYCGNETQNYILYDTTGYTILLPTNGGCAMGDSGFVPREGRAQCCPSGQMCDNDPIEGLVCIQRTVNCANLTEIDEDKCVKEGCFWIDSECVDNPLDYSCSIYETKEACTLDVWNVGSAGMGTEVCGKYFIVDAQGYVVPQGSCKCDWTASGVCALGYDVLPDIYGGTADTFRCQKDFDAGDCIDGNQLITWATNPIDRTGNFTEPILDSTVEAHYEAVLAASGCTPNAVGVDRPCGEPVIKLPGFSLFALMSSLGIIGLVYFFKKE